MNVLDSELPLASEILGYSTRMTSFFPSPHVDGRGMGIGLGSGMLVLYRF